MTNLQDLVTAALPSIALFGVTSLSICAAAYAFDHEIRQPYRKAKEGTRRALQAPIEPQSVDELVENYHALRTYSAMRLREDPAVTDAMRRYEERLVTIVKGEIASSVDTAASVTDLTPARLSPTYHRAFTQHRDRG